MGRATDKSLKFEKSGKSKNFKNFHGKLKFEDYPEYKCNLRPNNKSLEIKNDKIIKKDLHEETFKKLTSNYCTFYKDFSKSSDNLMTYLVKYLCLF